MRWTDEIGMRLHESRNENFMRFVFHCSSSASSSLMTGTPKNIKEY